MRQRSGVVAAPDPETFCAGVRLQCSSNRRCLQEMYCTTGGTCGYPSSAPPMSREARPTHREMSAAAQTSPWFRNAIPNSLRQEPKNPSGYSWLVSIFSMMRFTRSAYKSPRRRRTSAAFLASACRPSRWSASTRISSRSSSSLAPRARKLCPMLLCDCQGLRRRTPECTPRRFEHGGLVR